MLHYPISKARSIASTASVIFSSSASAPAPQFSFTYLFISFKVRRVGKLVHSVYSEIATDCTTSAFICGRDTRAGRRSASTG